MGVVRGSVSIAPLDSNMYNGDLMATGKFEDALTRIEEIVQALEKGDLSLEESVKRFEEGIKLSKQCMKMLQEAERKVEILMEDKDGAKQPRPFSESRVERDKQSPGLPGPDEDEDFEEDEDDDDDDEKDDGDSDKDEEEDR
jgi:exodeoxyribonuclease VII small subunit